MIRIEALDGANCNTHQLSNCRFKAFSLLNCTTGSLKSLEIRLARVSQNMSDSFL